MKAKFSFLWFGLGIAWLAGVVIPFAYASQTVGEDLQKGLIWFGVSLLIAVLGVVGYKRLNSSKK